MNEDREDSNDDGKHSLTTWNGVDTVDQADMAAFTLGNAFTWNLWLKPTGTNITGYPSATEPPRSIWALRDAVAGKIVARMDIRFSAIDSVGLDATVRKKSDNTLLKRFFYTDPSPEGGVNDNWPFDGGNWVMVTMTWDGTTMKMYSNGALLTGTAQIDLAGVAGTDTNAASFFTLNGGGVNSNLPWRGYWGHTAIWDTALDASNLVEVFNGKFGINLNSDTGNYNSSGDLNQYWKPGAINNVDRFGDSFNGGTNLLNSDDDFAFFNTNHVKIPIGNRSLEAPV